MRFSVSRTPGNLSIIIPRRFDLFYCLFLPLWLIGFILLSRNQPPNNRESYLAAGFFVVIALLMLHGWLWNLSGREELDFTADAFTYRRVLFGISRTRTFAMNEISAPRFVGSVRRGMHGTTPSGIRFSYRGKQIKFGDHLTQAEAKAVASTISREFPQYSSCWGQFDEGFPDSDKPVTLDLRQT
jgi:hypothetical protein